METTVKDVLEKAVYMHNKGQVSEAEVLYNQILEQYPDHSDANHNLGVLKAMLNDSKRALELFEKAVAVNPKYSQYWISLANCVSMNGGSDQEYLESIKARYLENFPDGTDLDQFF